MKFLVCLVVFSLSVYLSEGKAFLGSKLNLFNKGGYSDDNSISNGFGDSSASAGAISSGSSFGNGFGGGLGGGLGGGFGGILDTKIAAKTGLLEMKRAGINSLFDTIIGAKKSLAGGLGSLGGGLGGGLGGLGSLGLNLGGSSSSASAGAISGNYGPPPPPQFIQQDGHTNTWIVTEQRVPIQGPYPHFNPPPQPIPQIPHNTYGPPQAEAHYVAHDATALPNCTH